MPVKKTQKIWMNGTLVPWDEAKIHVLSHVVHYGSSWFEGIRCYNTKKGPAIFRLDAHIRRLYDSVRIYGAQITFSKATLQDGILETVQANGLKACYIRPFVYRGYGVSRGESRGITEDAQPRFSSKQDIRIDDPAVHFIARRHGKRSPDGAEVGYLWN